MRFRLKTTIQLIGFFLLCISGQSYAVAKDFRLHIHVHFLQKSDSWKVKYQLPIAVDHVAFSRKSNFDRTKLYNIDKSKFKWDTADDVLLIRSIDGSKFDSFDLTFASFYDDIQKDYTHNIKYSDSSVLLYTNHLALGANIIDDTSVSSIGKSFSDTQFHFYAPEQNIVFLGDTFKSKAEWTLKGDGTYVYFGDIAPIESNNMIAIVDPKLPAWAWKNTQSYFPKLFEYYEKKTGQALSFKPVVFFNYDQTAGDFSSYSGGTLDGLVQLTISGSQWQAKNSEQFNMLFHFLAHEAAHFWNGQMFAFEDQKHSWMHEGGADAFAFFAMREFGLIDSAQMLQRFEEAANSCIMRKGKESLAESAKLRRYRNYYTCGATMALASHYAVQAKNPEKTIFDVWKRIFDVNKKSRSYSQADFFNELSQLSGSSKLSHSFAMFSDQSGLNNQTVITSWFNQSQLKVVPSSNYPESITRHWGKQVIFNLMRKHCKRVSFRSFSDYIKTDPVENCKGFEKSAEIQFIDGLEIFNEGIAAYNAFKNKCQSSDMISLQDRNKALIIELPCLDEVPSIQPYLEFEVKS